MVSSIYIKYVAGHLLELQIFSDCPLHDIVHLPYQILLKMPMADITLSSGTWLWYDGSSILHSRFNVQVQILQSSTKIFSFNNFYRPPDILQNLGFVKYIPTICTTTYIETTIQCQVWSSLANRSSDSHLLKLTYI